MRKSFPILLILSTLLFACGPSAQEQVDSRERPSTVTDSVQTDSAKKIKASPARASIQGSYYATQLTVTPTNRAITGVYYRADISTDQQRR